MRNVLLGGLNHYPYIRRIASQWFAVACLVASLVCAQRILGAEGDNLWLQGTEVPNSHGTFHHISDGAGGTFIAFTHSSAVYAVRLNAAGSLLWGPVLLSAPGETGSLPRLCSDGSGGALVAWAQNVTSGSSQIYVRRINAAGTPLWASPVAASNTSSIDSLAVAGGNQGVFLIYRTDVSLYAAYISASGVLASPGIGGLSLGTARTFGAQPCVVPDGSGGNGAIVAWADVFKDIQAQKVVLSGGSTLSAAWGSGSPVLICSTTGDGYYPTLAEDDSGGALISWTEINLWPPAKTDIRVQKINSSGVTQWTANGVVVVDSSTVGGSTWWQYGETTSAVATDGSGGAYAAWNDWRNDSGAGDDDIYAQRLNGSGVPQWTSGGISLPYYAPGSQRRPAMVRDLQGGALVTFQDKGGWSWDISLVKLNSTGKVWFKWPFVDSHSQSDPGEDQLDPAIIYDASGLSPKGCIVVWTEDGSKVVAQKVQIGAGSADLALQGTGILGTESAGGVDTPVFNQGVGANINDGNLSTRVDTWNSTGTDPLSYVGILWSQPQAGPVLRLELTLATFGDGGWFGLNNEWPGYGALLSPTYLIEPDIQVTTDGGATWSPVDHTSDYLTALNGHGIGGGAFPNPSSVTATFMLNTPAANINGIRLLGSEGGIASSGFLGVFELAVYAFTDSDGDDMDDAWESSHGLEVGVNDATADPDGDGLSNVQEFTRSTDPHNPDTDGDGFADGVEVQVSTNPTSAGSMPNNLARRIGATGILGTMNSLGGTATPVFHMGTAANINDGNFTSRVDTWNSTGTNPLSYVGILWAQPQTQPISCLRLDLATFGDGGWFGPNNQCPGPGGLLSPTYLTEPDIQVTTDNGATWSPVDHTSDYIASLTGHGIGGGAFPNPTSATAIFKLNTPAANINGVRIIGTEGGIASGGFLGVFELGALTKIPVKLLNPNVDKLLGEFRFEFDSQPGSAYEIQVNESFIPANWQTVGNVQGDGTRKTVVQTFSPTAVTAFVRVITQ